MELEFLICQYLDGSLEGEGREDLESRLAMDANARALLETHRRLDTLFAEHAPAVTNVDWDGFADRVATAIAKVGVRSAENAEPAVSENAPQARRPFSFNHRLWLAGRPSARLISGLAVAASVLIAIGIAFHIHTPRGGDVVVVPNPTPLAAALQVSGPQAEFAPGGGISEVSIGPGKALDSNAMAMDDSDDLVSRPSHVVIASGINLDQDGSGLPY